MGHLTPFPPDGLVYIGATLSWRFPLKEECVSPFSHPFPLILLSARIPLKAAAVETLKCSVCISSQLLKSLPLSPSAPFLSFSIHG